MGFWDSMKTGLEGVGDFVTDIVGAGLAAAPTVIPILQSTGVLPVFGQPSTYPGIVPGGAGGGYTPPSYGAWGGPGSLPAPRPGPTALPGGAMTPYPFTPRVNPAARAVPGAYTSAFPTSGGAVPATYSPGGVGMAQFQTSRPGFQTAGGLLNGGLDLPFIDIVGQGGGQQLSRLTSPFVPTQAGARAQHFVAPNPISGKLTWFKPAGKPILWSGDLTACRRVGRIAARARRSRGKR